MFELFFIDFNHIVFIIFSFTHHLLLALVVFILIVHELTFGLSDLLHHHLLLLLLVHFIVVLDGVLHSFDAFVLHLVLLFHLVFVFSHLILVDLVHVLLLLLDGLGNSSLLLGVKLIEVLDVLFSHKLLLLL